MLAPFRIFFKCYSELRHPQHNLFKYKRMLLILRLAVQWSRWRIKMIVFLIAFLEHIHELTGSWVNSYSLLRCSLLLCIIKQISSVTPLTLVTHLEGESSAELTHFEVSEAIPASGTMLIVKLKSMNFHSLDSTPPGYLSLQELFHGPKYFATKWSRTATILFAWPLLVHQGGQRANLVTGGWDLGLAQWHHESSWSLGPETKSNPYECRLSGGFSIFGCVCFETLSCLSPLLAAFH